MFHSFYLALCLLIGDPSGAPPKDTAMAKDIYHSNTLLARTMNIGYALGSNTSEKQSRPVTHEDLARIKKAGFTAVRLPVNWVSAMDQAAPYALQASFLSTIDSVIGYALRIHLAVVLDNHTDEQLMEAPQQFKDRFLSLWEQLSRHYKGYPPELMFELLAEPHGKMDNDWPQYLRSSLSIVRKDNPDRAVIIGPSLSNRPQMLPMLSLPPDDRHIIVTFHQYIPIKFTMQGEQWFPFGKPMEWLGTRWPAEPDDESAITQLIKDVAAWADKNKRPVFMGEFGVSSNADPASAAHWIKFNREAAEKQGFSWGYWSCYALRFNIFNEQTSDWKGNYLDALIPGSIPVSASSTTDQTIRPVTTGITATTILQKCIDAMGGAQRIATITGIFLGGTAMMGDHPLTLEEKYLLPAGSYEETIQLNGMPFLHTIVRSGMTSVTVQGHDRQLTGEDKELLEEKSNPFPELYLLSRKTYDLSVSGIQLVNGEDCYIIKIRSPLGRVFYNYYSIKTGLLQKTASTQKTSTGDTLYQTRFENYKTVEGVLIATKLTNDRGPVRMEARFTKITIEH
ncbi:MAG TPA: glycoside hydrolase family 5 protein [Puia sp.]|jgi:endoglucanase